MASSFLLLQNGSKLLLQNGSGILLTADVVADSNPVTLTVRDAGHTATITDAGHSLTIRERGPHTATLKEQHH